ncbi:acyl carrier protein [Nostoc sp.]|uniref:acyl carrier protein n=1 Tax=Nostoc sp. TaxID=1180 RepID=UPI002FFBC895
MKTSISSSSTDNTWFSTNNLIEILSYLENEHNIKERLNLLDKNSSFEKKYADIWNLELEVYQICKNWLKSRDVEYLNQEDTRKYQNLVMSLKEIVQLVEDIKIKISHTQLKKLQVFRKIQSVIADKLETQPEKITLISNFASDLGADSLDIGELFLALEEAFKIKIPNKFTEVLLTVQQTIDYINQKV